jgi:hypothetical protein
VIYLKACKSDYNKDSCTAMFIAALFTIASSGNHQDVPLLMDQENVVFIYNGILFSHAEE